MKVVILAGGKGTRISEESKMRPKPMVEIGGRPILWHIMRQYAAYGFEEFIVCCGYKGHMIKEILCQLLPKQQPIRDSFKQSASPNPDEKQRALEGDAGGYRA